MTRCIGEISISIYNSISSLSGRKFLKESNKTKRCDVLGQVWYLIVSIPDLCLLTYFVMKLLEGFLFLVFCVHRGPHMSAHFLLNLLNELGKSYKMRGFNAFSQRV